MERVTLRDTLDAFVAVDILGDGRLDLVVNQPTRRGLAVLARGATARHGEAGFLATGIEPKELVAGELNGDDVPDFVVLAATGEARSLLSDPQSPGGYRLQEHPWTLPRARRLHLADVDNDGHLDLLSIRRGASSVWVVFGAASGLSRPGRISLGGGRVQDMAVADVNGDGRTDLAIVDHEAIRLAVQEPDGSFALEVRESPGRDGVITVANVDSDGRPDFIVFRAGSVHVHRNREVGEQPWREVIRVVSVQDLGHGSPQVAWSGDADGTAAPEAFCSYRVQEGGATVERVVRLTGLPPLDGNRNSVLDVCERFVRGDTNGDGRVNMTDAVVIATDLFIAGAFPDCQDAADVDNNGRLELTDSVYLLNALFLNGATIPAPGWPLNEAGAHACGRDPEGGDLGCKVVPPGCAD